MGVTVSDGAFEKTSEQLVALLKSGNVNDCVVREHDALQVPPGDESDWDLYGLYYASFRLDWEVRSSSWECLISQVWLA